MPNLLLETPEYKVTRTRFGTWRGYLYESGQSFSEFRSHGTFLGLPWVHYTRGRSPETGRRVVAKGVLAVGRVATGILAVGQAAFGLVAIGQLGLGVLLGLGQATCGWTAVGQVALGVRYGLGQLATGAVVVAQLGLGGHVLAQLGWGHAVWSTNRHDPEAVQYFTTLWQHVQEEAGRLF
jgi:hypothetical protein